MVQKKKLKEGKGESILYQGKKSVSRKAGTSGITLVALVVTIVVLLILAGITIMYVMGDNGVFDKAKNAKEKTETATFEERLGLAIQDAVMQRAINGGLSPEEYFDILKKHGIISDTTVGGENIAANPTENSDGSKTYEITSDDDYIFEVTIYPDGKVETEVIGKDGNIEAKIRSILVTNKTKNSIDIRVLARLQGGTVKAYYKLLDDVVANEPENSIDGYTEITLNESLEGTLSGLTAGKEYKIKAILKNGETVVNVKSIQETAKPPVLIESITLNKTSLTLEVEGKETLTATIKPDDADNKTLTWTSSEPTIATVSSTGEITGVKAGETTITVTANDAGKKSAACKVTVIEKGAIPYSWEELGKIAEAISNTTTYKETTTSISVEVEGASKTLKVGDWTRIGTQRVRILGFNHDTLTTNTAYNGKTTATGKAGISFEFLDCLMDSTPMHSSNDNTNGWITKSIYTTLNNTTNGKYKELQNAGIPIKQVQKTYNATYSKSDTKTSSDYLWLLSCTEIWGDSAYTGCVSAYSKAVEGEQYAFFSNCTPKPVYNSGNTNVVHYNSAGTSATDCWLRSPFYNGNPGNFCYVDTNGHCSGDIASYSSGIAPGFSI